MHVALTVTSLLIGGFNAILDPCHIATAQIIWPRNCGNLEETAMLIDVLHRFFGPESVNTCTNLRGIIFLDYVIDATTN